MLRPILIGVGYVAAPKSIKNKWLRDRFEAGGPLYIKFGQFIANRGDIFDKDLSETMAKLQDRVTPLSWEVMGPKINQAHYEHIEQVPIATASMAQVYRAKLKSGETVAVKVKKPNVTDQVTNDLRMLKRVLNVKWFDEFEYMVEKETDFENEVLNIQSFYEMYQYSQTVCIPKVYTKLCDENVIVMSYEPSSGQVKARDLIRVFINQLLYEDIIHGDLHSGNIGHDGTKTILYDFGNVIRTNRRYRALMRDFVYHVQTKDVKATIQTMEQLGMKIVNESVTSVFIEKFFAYIDTLDIASFKFDPDEIQEKVPVKLDATTASILRSYALLEGYCKRIDPTFTYQDILAETLETMYLDLDYIIHRASKDVAFILS
jgi:ubiquinone biosynthesis protein